MSIFNRPERTGVLSLTPLAEIILLAVVTIVLAAGAGAIALV